VLARPGNTNDGNTSVVLNGTTGYVSIPSTDALNPASALSVEAWAAPTSASTSQTVARKEGQYLVRISGGTVVFRIWNGKSYSASTDLVSPAVVTAGTAQQITTTYDGATMRIFRNGVQVASKAATGALLTSTTPLELGRSAASFDQYQGKLDDVAVYKTAIPAATVKNHYAAATPAPAPAPAPAQSPAPPASSDQSSCSSSFGKFSASNQPGACWRPYADTSPFNRALGSSPKLDPNSSAIVSTLTGWGKPEDLYSATDTKNDWTHPIYYSQSSDPVYTVHCTKAWGTCAVEGMKVHIPAKARPAAGGDGHMAVIDQAGGQEYDFWQVATNPLPAGGGTVNISWGGHTPIGGNNSTGLDSYATAAHFGVAAGVIRAEELQQGKIDHALFMVVHCDAAKQVYPASGLGSACSGVANAPAEGQRFFLDMTSAQIDAANVPTWKKTIMHAMATYGMYVGDTGSPSWGLMVESGTSYTAMGQPDQLTKFMKSQADSSVWNGSTYLPLGDGVDWSKSLKVAAPCTAQGTC
jgi:hypothetical protein